MVVWQAELNDEETPYVDDTILDEMYERLDKLWQELKDELLYA